MALNADGRQAYSEQTEVQWGMVRSLLSAARLEPQARGQRDRAVDATVALFAQAVAVEADAVPRAVPRAVQRL